MQSDATPSPNGLSLSKPSLKASSRNLQSGQACNRVSPAHQMCPHTSSRSALPLHQPQSFLPSGGHISHTLSESPRII